MDVSPKTLREVEFREKMRGYHPEDVDQFLERMAAGVEVLQDRLRQAIERAQRAEQAASEVGGSDDALRRTLVLAQRTADLAVQEAREEAARIVADAAQQAHAVMSEAEQRARKGHEETIVEVQSELSRLEARREQLQLEILELTSWFEQHRTQLRRALDDAVVRLDQVDLSIPRPNPEPAEVPPASRYEEPQPAPGAPTAEWAPDDAPPPPPPPPVQLSGQHVDSAAVGPDTLVWRPEEANLDPAAGPAGPAEPEESDPYFAELRRAISDQDPLRAPPPESS